MSEGIVYQEEVDSGVAKALIGEDNLRDGSSYYLVSTAFDSTVLRKEANGDETEFLLEDSEPEPYDDGLDFAKIEPEVEDGPYVSKMGLYIAIILLIVIMLAIVGGIACMAYIGRIAKGV